MATAVCSSLPNANDDTKSPLSNAKDDHDTKSPARPVLPVVGSIVGEKDQNYLTRTSLVDILADILDLAYCQGPVKTSVNDGMYV
jgi:hypothetical protein